MGRSIQGLEDLHHGFPVDGVGQRHSCFAFETVVGAGDDLSGDFKGYVLHPDKSFQRLIKYRLILGGQLVICGPSTHQHCLFLHIKLSVLYDLYSFGCSGSAPFIQVVSGLHREPYQISVCPMTTAHIKALLSPPSPSATTAASQRRSQLAWQSLVRDP